MGAGIARIFADGGASVSLTARREKSLAAARERAGEAVAMTTDLDETLTGAELVVETIVEEVEPKRAVLARAEELAAPDAILTTNTSSLSVDDVGGELQRPEGFAGLHFLNPPELVQVVEIVGGSRTAPETL
jgi:3-hydroxyacyl-CoA dehydrogenase